MVAEIQHSHSRRWYHRWVTGGRGMVLGAVISVPIVVTLGYLFGGQIEVVLGYIGGVEKLVWLVVALSLGVIAMRMLMFTREHGGTPT